MFTSKNDVSLPVEKKKKLALRDAKRWKFGYEKIIDDYWIIN